MCDTYDPISGNCKYCDMPKSLHYGNHKRRKHIEGNFGKETGLSIGGRPYKFHSTNFVIKNVALTGSDAKEITKAINKKIKSATIIFEYTPAPNDFLQSLLLGMDPAHDPSNGGSNIIYGSPKKDEPSSTP